MNKKTKAKLHTRLKLIKKCLATDPSKLNDFNGLCRAVKQIKQPKMYFNLESLFPKWPKCHFYVSTNRHSYSFPVGGIHEFTDDVDNGTMWTNPKRLELLDWLIEETKP